MEWRANHQSRSMVVTGNFADPTSGKHSFALEHFLPLFLLDFVPGKLDR